MPRVAADNPGFEPLEFQSQWLFSTLRVMTDCAPASIVFLSAGEAKQALKTALIVPDQSRHVRGSMPLAWESGLVIADVTVLVRTVSAMGRPLLRMHQQITCTEAADENRLERLKNRPASAVLEPRWEKG